MLQSTSSFPVSEFKNDIPGPGQFRASVSWGAVIAGLAAAIALEVLFMMLGAGLGFAIYSPVSDTNPLADFGTGAIVIQGVSAVFSLWFGGWVAGRFAPLGIRMSGWLHGFTVWCAATVAGILFVSGGAGWALGDLSKLVGGGLSLAGKPAAAVAGGAADVAKDAAKQSGDVVTSFIDEALGRMGSGANPANSVRAKREIGFAIARLFNPAQQGKMTENRAALVKALVDNTGMSDADADLLVTSWATSYARLKADLGAALEEAEAKAREAADKAAKTLSVLSFCAFVGFALGAVSASLGACHGARCAQKHAGTAATA